MNRRMRASLAFSAFLAVAMNLFSTMGAGKTVTLEVLWPTYTPAKIKYGEELARLFEEAHPDIDVELSLTPDPYGKLTVLVAGGVAPDVVWMGAGWSQFWQQLEDLRPLIDRDRTEVNPNDFFAPIWQSMQFRGRDQILSNGAQVSVMYYNKDLFDNAGIGYPSERWTWDDMITFAKRLTVDRDGNGTDQWSVNLDWGYLEGLTGYAGYNGSKDWIKVAWNVPANRTLLHQLRALWEIHRVDAPPSVKASLGTPIQQFQQHQVAMMVGAMWGISNYRGVVDFDWDVQVLPMLEVDGTLVRGGSGLWTDELGLVKGSKHREEAWEFIKFFASQKMELWALQEGHVFPSRRSAALSDLVLRPKQKPMNMVAFAKTMEFAVPVGPHPAGYSRLNREFARIVWPAVWGESSSLTIEAALAEADRIGQQILDEWNRDNPIDRR